MFVCLFVCFIDILQLELTSIVMTDNKVDKVSEKRGKVINQNKKYDIENCHRTISI